jgi:hypothetical protein
MKFKILIISLLSTISIISFANASELLLKPSHWSFSPWCTIWVDIVADPEGKQISATDIVIESSMEFIKFEPTQLFPYFLPPKVLKNSNIVHIVWFTIQPSQRVKEKWTIWKIYFKPKNQSDKDGSIKFYFKKIWDTTDSNLSIAWWVDTLEDVRNWFYTFDWTTCEYPEIKTTISNNEQDIINLTKQIHKDHNAAIRQRKRAETIQKIKTFWNDNKYYAIAPLIIIIVLITYIKVRKWKSSKK